MKTLIVACLAAFVLIVGAGPAAAHGPYFPGYGYVPGAPPLVVPPVYVPPPPVYPYLPVPAYAPPYLFSLGATYEVRYWARYEQPIIAIWWPF